MADVAPFRGLRYTAEAGPLGDLLAPPYDIISAEERERLYARSPRNIVRVEFGRAEPGDDDARDADARTRTARNKYARARAALEAWTAEGALARDGAPCFYLYDHHFTVTGVAAKRRGLLGALRLYPEGSLQVLPHERTIPKDRADRMSLLRATRTNVSPIFGMVDDGDGVLAGALAAGMTAERQVADVRQGDERHVVWKLDGGPAAALAALLAPKRVYLADGHHRYETARAYLEEERAAGRSPAADDPAAFVLAFVCALEDPGLRIFPTHRIVTGARAALDAAIASSFEATPIPGPAIPSSFEATPIPGPQAASEGIVLVRDGAFTALRPRAALDRRAMPAIWRGIPIAEAETFLLPAAREAGGVVRYEHDAATAIASARGDTAAVLLAAVDARALQRVADAGERLPQKTTYFYPKVPTGLVLRPLD